MKSFLPLLVLVGAAAGATVDSCGGCKPWMNDCKIDDSIDIRFAVGAIETCTGSAAASDCGTNNGTKYQCSNTNGCVGYKTHFFCGKVDQFTSVELKDSATYMEGAVPETDGNYSGYLDIVQIGAGKLGNDPETKVIPEREQSSRIPVYQKSHPKCNDGPAIANFLVYNVTMTRGKYEYKNNDPTGNGFVNTCDGDRCDFVSNSVCIKGAEGKYNNCGQCLNPTYNNGDNANDIRVLITYYGTDKSNNVLLSGSSNPMNFRQFALDNVASTIGNDFNNIKFP
eukprot:TRINITY_DN37558_c0_g1_i1.p1 TRINITY_DN37558_c0_g1~~TRINITY_DN37558_c0_g1_i1.p1  ORF type:complete len:303 (+),score=85.70 TRINITY_DN37558_c0_g1_i1:65-910(+)